jgi:hypothetical protein
MPRGAGVYGGYYHASPECWSVYGEVLAAEYQNALLFGQVHQLAVDAYAAQHAGGPHPDKSVCIHLVGLHLVLERNVAPPDVPSCLRRLASAVTVWPHLPPPEERGPLTVFDVAAAESPQQHASRARAWAEQLWRVWSPHHEAVAELASLQPIGDHRAQRPANRPRGGRHL